VGLGALEAMGQRRGWGGQEWGQRALLWGRPSEESTAAAAAAAGGGTHRRARQEGATSRAAVFTLNPKPPTPRP
jgi:hypothetical protein